jgi:ubiquinol-cytochrome c reductase iron-sulfur subunit
MSESTHHTDASSETAHEGTADGVKRRNFLVLSAQAFGGLGAAALIWPFVDSMNPSADVLAMASTEVDVSSVKEGQEIRVMWRGKPVFIRHRSAKEIEEANKVDVSELRDPQKDSDRVKKGKEQWMVMLGVCTHLGCVPLGNNSGDYDGWFCPCHGSHYDTSGRIRKGPAPTNLTVPQYDFITDTKIKIG